MKRFFLVLILAAAVASFGCSSDEQTRDVSKSQQAIVKQDGSTIEVKDTQGIKSETRTFESGDIARATRLTKADGSRRALVEFRDGRTVELKEKSEIDGLMDDSAERIKDAATRTWEAVRAAGADAAEKGKEVGQQVSDKTKQGAEAAKDAAAKVAEATGEGLKKAGQAVKNAGKKIKDKVKQ